MTRLALFVVLQLALLLALLSAGCQKDPQATPAPEADARALAVIERYLQAIGGRENLALIQDRSTYYLNKKHTPAGTVETQMARFNKGEFKIREQWEFPNWGMNPGQEPLTIIQTYDGQKGHVKMMGHGGARENKPLTMRVWDKYIDDPFLHWEQDGFTAKYKGESEVASILVVRVDLETCGSPNRQSFYFRKDDGLLMKKEWISEDPNGGSEQKQTFYSEYKKIRFADAPDRFILVPLSEKIFTEGELDLEREYTEIRINSGLSDDLFADSRPAK